MISRDAGDTLRFGESLGRIAEPGLTVTLSGELGAGKTTFIRGAARGLDVPGSLTVSSPTFVLVHEYFGRLPVYHVDAYRLRSAVAASELGLEEIFSQEAVCFVEWPERIGEWLPQDRIDINFAILAGDHREMVVVGLGLKESFLSRWKAVLPR